MKIPLIKVENLKKSFSENKVLDGINFEVYQGEILGIVGLSGSGKTTLLKTLIGFYTSDSGDVLFLDKENRYVSVFERTGYVKRKYGFAAQMPSFYSNLTVFENIDFFGALYGLSDDSTLNNMTILLELVELANARDVLAKNLSGGMQRRLDIACAMIHDPSVLILDEPTSDLDPTLSKHIWRLLQKINRRGTTIIVASHHLEDMEQICSRIGVLSKGKITHIGTIHELAGSLSRGQELRIESYPGNYDKIIRNLNDPVILSKENDGTGLIIKSSKPEKALMKLLQTLESLDETLIDVKTSRLGLGEVFKEVTRK